MQLVNPDGSAPSARKRVPFGRDRSAGWAWQSRELKEKDEIIFAEAGKVILTKEKGFDGVVQGSNVAAEMTAVIRFLQ